MKKFFNKSDYILIACLLLILIVFAAGYNILSFFKVEYYYIILFVSVFLILFCGLALLLGIKITKKIKLIFNKNFDNTNFKNTFCQRSVSDFTFTLNKIWPNFGNQKYVAPYQSPALLKQLKNTESASEAIKIAEQLNFTETIKIGSLPCSVIKPLFIKIFDTLTFFPHMKKGFCFLGSMSELLFHLKNIKNISYAEINKIETILSTAMTTLNIRAVAFQAGATLGIAINDKIYSNKINSARDKTKLLSEAFNGVFPVSCNTFEAVIDHEIGHIFDFVLGVSLSNDLMNFTEGLSEQEIKKELGSYALVNYKEKRELIAVAYADKQNSKKPSYISIKINQMIEKFYNRQFLK